MECARTVRLQPRVGRSLTSTLSVEACFRLPRNTILTPAAVFNVSSTLYATWEQALIDYRKRPSLIFSLSGPECALVYARATSCAEIAVTYVRLRARAFIFRGDRKTRWTSRSRVIVYSVWCLFDSRNVASMRFQIKDLRRFQR